MKRIKNLIDNVASSSSTHTGGDEAALLKKPSVSQQAPISPANQPNTPTLSSIKSYFSSTSESDMPICELEKLPADATKELILAISERERMYLENVSKKLSNTILENQPSYDKELQRVRDLQKALKEAYVTCQKGKNHMSFFQSDRSLKLLLQYQHRRNLLNLQNSLKTIKTLEYTDVRLMELMKEEKYPDAIQLCLECRQVSIAYGHYHCIKDLAVKMQDTLEQIEEQIDEALSKVCYEYDESTYARLQTSYKLLGKKQIAIDQLLMHFTTCVHKTAFKTIREHAANAAEDPAVLQKKTFADLCRYINLKTFIPCLIALCKSLSNVLWCYQLVFYWHIDEKSKTSSASSVEIDQSYILQKLAKGKHRVWSDVQSKVKVLLVSADMANLEYEQFLKIIDITNIIISVGEKLCAKSSLPATEEVKFSSDLQNPIYDLSLQYFRAYHKKCMDELNMYLANEAWESCPVNEDFSVLELPDFKPLHAANRRKIMVDASPEESSDKTKDADDVPFTKLFDISSECKKKTETLSPFHDKGDDMLDEYSAIASGPILTNSALNILRICGKYLSMCEVLQPISAEVVVRMSQLFDYYLVSLYKIFTPQNSHNLGLSGKLSTTLQRIMSELIQHEEMNGGDRVPLPTLSPMVDITKKDILYGFHHRIIAAESLMNLAEQFKLLQPNLEKVLKEGKVAFLHQFFAQTVDICNEVRCLVYYPVALGGLDYNLTVKQIPEVHWSVTEIMSQHNKYVDDILLQCKIFESKLLSMLSGSRNLNDIITIIWKYCAILCNNAFVEGYSFVKKCSNEGRALMQLDYQQFISKFEELSKLSPAPGKPFVENYLKAFYLSEDDFDAWKEKHPEYSEKQLSSLLSCITLAASASKSKRRKVRNLLDDMKGKK